MTGVLIRGDWDEDIHTGGRPCEDTGRRQPSTSLGEGPHEKTTLQHFDLGLPVSKTVRKCISVVSAARSVVNSLQQPSTVIQRLTKKFQPKEVHSIYLFQDTATGHDQEERHTAR